MSSSAAPTVILEIRDEIAHMNLLAGAADAPAAFLEKRAPPTPSRPP